MYFRALEAINASVISNTSNVLEGAAQVIAMPWLTGASKWYLLKTDGVIRSMIGPSVSSPGEFAGWARLLTSSSPPPGQ